MDTSSRVSMRTDTLNPSYCASSITTKEVWRQGNGSKEMHVETTAQTPNGEQKRKTVYTRS